MTASVLIGCERSGVIRRAFERLGVHAMSCDLEPADDDARSGLAHLQGDVLDALKVEITHGIAVSEV